MAILSVITALDEEKTRIDREREKEKGRETETETATEKGRETEIEIERVLLKDPITLARTLAKKNLQK